VNAGDGSSTAAGGKIDALFGKARGGDCRQRTTSGSRSTLKWRWKRSGGTCPRARRILQGVCRGRRRGRRSQLDLLAPRRDEIAQLLGVARSGAEGADGAITQRGFRVPATLARAFK
jgi:hypothetical protein